MPIYTANLLTALRIFLLPVLVLAFYMNTSTWRHIIAFVFIFGCITDYLDGYIARTFSQTSKLGQFLDPIADKLLVSSTLLLLAGFNRIDTYTLIPAIVILSREILVSGLREHLGTFRVSLSVSRLAKWKTFLQMFAICLLLIGDTFEHDRSMHYCGEFLLWIAAFLTILTGYKYLKSSLRYF